MYVRRIWVAWALFLLVGGTISSTAMYGLYYRSHRYRLNVQRELTAFFGLPTDVASIEPHGFSAQRLTDTQMWLPDRRARIFYSPRVIWDTDGGDQEGAVLRIDDAVLTIGSQAWQREDYMRVLRASLLHNFSEFDVRRVQFRHARLSWPREDFALEATGVDGEVIFDEQGRGVAELTTRSLNGTTVVEPIRIFARLDPYSPDDFIPEVTLHVPTLPLVVLGLDYVLRSRITQGSFAGRITLYQAPEGDRLELSGVAKNVRLEEWTQRLSGGPLPAIVDLTIDEAIVRDRRLERIRFSGEVRSLQADSLLARFGLPALGGELNVTVYNGQIAGEKIERLGVAGQWTGASLDALTHAVWHQHRVAGQLNARVNVFMIENNEVVTGNVDVLAEPPADQRGTIDRSLLLDLLHERLDLTLPPELTQLLPNTIEYVQMGCKLLIDTDQIRLLSVQGPAGPALMTVRVFNQNIPLLGQVDTVLPIEPILERARVQAQQVKKVLKSRFRRKAASRPHTSERNGER